MTAIKNTLTPATRKLLKQIDTVLSGPDGQTSEQVWIILTALRGPDKQEDEKMKDTGTAIIRGAAFPQCLAKASHYYSRAYFRGWQIADGQKVNLPGNDHFKQHAQRAARVLDLAITEHA